jgi:hypothetical protein
VKDSVLERSALSEIDALLVLRAEREPRGTRNRRLTACTRTALTSACWRADATLPTGRRRFDAALAGDAALTSAHWATRTALATGRRHFDSAVTTGRQRGRAALAGSRSAALAGWCPPNPAFPRVHRLLAAACAATL